MCLRDLNGERSSEICVQRALSNSILLHCGIQHSTHGALTVLYSILGGRPLSQFHQSLVSNSCHLDSSQQRGESKNFSKTVENERSEVCCAMVGTVKDIANRREIGFRFPTSERGAISNHFSAYD
ncbi:hypothetical protein ACLB2K_031080 [Fragaria x ananassa]